MDFISADWWNLWQTIFLVAIYFKLGEITSALRERKKQNEQNEQDEIYYNRAKEIGRKFEARHPLL